MSHSSITVTSGVEEIQVQSFIDFSTDFKIFNLICCVQSAQVNYNILTKKTIFILPAIDNLKYSEYKLQERLHKQHS
jgi:hypothetical protein